MKKSIQAVVLSVIIFAAVISGLSILASRKENLKSESESESILPFDNTSNTNEYEVYDDISGIEIDWQSGDISIEPYESDFVTIKETGKESLQGKEYLNYKVDDGILYVSYNKSSISAFLKNLKAVDCEIYVPASMFDGLKADITVETLNSDIDLSGFKLNDLNLKTLSGNIDLIGVDVTSCTLKSVSGNINVSNSVIQVLECNNTSGSIESATSSKDLIINNVSGSVNIQCSDLFERADIKTVSGSVVLSLPDNKGMTISVSKISGGFSCDFEVTQDDDTYIYGNGQIPLNIKTTSGSIRIKKEN